MKTTLKISIALLVFFFSAVSFNQANAQDIDFYAPTAWEFGIGGEPS